MSGGLFAAVSIDELMARCMPGEAFAALEVEFAPEGQSYWLVAKGGERAEISADDARAIHLEAARDFLRRIGSPEPPG